MGRRKFIKKGEKKAREMGGRKVCRKIISNQGKMERKCVRG